MSVSKDTLLVGGINVNVHSLPKTSRPVAVLFLLHGRLRSSADSEWVAERILKETAEKESGSSINFDLLVITFVGHLLRVAMVIVIGSLRLGS